MTKDEKTTWFIEQVTPLGAVRSKKMFGGVGFFLDEVMFAKLTGDATLYFRVDDSNRADYEALGGEQFNSSSKGKGMPYYHVPAEVVEDTDRLIEWARTAHQVAIANKQK